LATQQVFYVIRLYTVKNSIFLNFTPKKTPKLKGLFMGFPVLSQVKVPTKLDGGKPS